MGHMESVAIRIPPTVVHVRKAPFDLYIGRAFAEFPASKWQNPFHLADPNDIKERYYVVEQYRQHILSRPDLIAALPELEGKALGCWCRPKYPCHGDMLVELFIEKVLKAA
jgi:hypothetical protein